MRTVGPESLNQGRTLPVGERENIISYLSSGSIIFAAHGRQPDHFQPDAEPVPVVYLTDGEWVYGWDIIIYVQQYGYALPDEFLLRIRAAGYICVEPSDESVNTAYRLVTGQE